jgi:hypothetical protein
MVLDLMADLDPKGEGNGSMPANRQPCPGAWDGVPGKIRVIRRKLNCLNPSLQEMQLLIRRKGAWNRRQSLRRHNAVACAILWELERCPVRVFKETL